MHRSRLSKCILADYRYQKDNVVGTYMQDQRPYLEQNHQERMRSDENWSMDKDIKKVASIPKVEWLKLKSWGLDQDPKALLKYLEIRAQHLKTTTKCLI